jgi:eukaryotic translation initiation factor 2C
VNTKLFGVNQSLDMPKLGIIVEGKTMVVGIHVTHPSPGSLLNALSIAAMVASTDKTLSQFPYDLNIQTGRVEMVQDIGQMMKSRLELWRVKNKALPENILVYRDGVSKGQYALLQTIKIPAMRAVCNAL